MGIGRVIGTNVMETRFRIDFEENLQVGELLVVESQNKEGKYLVRVMDIEHAADKEDSSWMSRTAGMIMKKDNPDMSPYEQYLFCIGVSPGAAWRPGQRVIGIAGQSFGKRIGSLPKANRRLPLH